MYQSDEDPATTWRKEIERQGTSVMQGDAPCKAWKKEHANCFGCPDALGCRKLIEVMLLQCEAMHYEPHDFEDQLRTSEIVGQKTASILQANDIEEIKTIMGRKSLET